MWRQIAWWEQGRLFGWGIYRMPAFPTRAKTVEEVRAGRQVERTERRGARVGKWG